MLLGLATYYVYQQVATVYDQKKRSVDALQQREARQKEKEDARERRKNRAIRRNEVSVYTVSGVLWESQFTWC